MGRAQRAGGSNSSGQQLLPPHSSSSSSSGGSDHNAGVGAAPTGRAAAVCRQDVARLQEGKRDQMEDDCSQRPNR